MANKKSQKRKSKNNRSRVRFPKDDQVLGVVEKRLGGSRMRVRCFDGNERICRIPGSLKRYLWIRENDVVLVEPWEMQGDEKGDVVYKYKKNQVNYLKRKGYLSDLDEFREF